MSCWKFIIILLPLFITFALDFSVKWLLVFDDISEQQRLEIHRLTSHLDTSLMVLNLNKDQIKQYQKDGYLIYRDAIDENVLEAMKISVNHVMEHPNGLLQRGNGSKFCGFSLHNDILLDFWRNFMFKLPLSVHAAKLMETSQVVYSQDIIHSDVELMSCIFEIILGWLFGINRMLIPVYI